MYLQSNSLSPGLIQHKVRNDSPLAFLSLSVQDVEIKWGLRKFLLCSLQAHVGRIQDTACYANVLYVQVQAYYTYICVPVGNLRKKKFRLAAFMQATMLSLLSKYAGDPSPRVPALPACLHYYYPMACTYAPPPFVFENPHRPKGKKAPFHSLK